MKKRFSVKSEKGSASIEASVYIPLMMLITVFFIYIFIIISYKANVDSVLEVVIDKSEIYLNDSRVNIDTSKKEILMELSIFDDLYKNPLNYKEFILVYTKTKDTSLYEFSYENEKINLKLKKITDYMYDKINKNTIFLDKIIIETKLNNGPIKPKIEIIVRSFIKIPFINKKIITLESNLTKTLVKPQDTIRNIDLSLEYLEKIIEGIDINGLLERFKK